MEAFSVFGSCPSPMVCPCFSPPLVSIPPSLSPSLPNPSPYLVKHHHKRYTRQAKACLEHLFGGGIDEEMREAGPLPVDEKDGGKERGVGGMGRKEVNKKGGAEWVCLPRYLA